MMYTHVCRNGILFRQWQKYQYERLFVINCLIMFTQMLSNILAYLYIAVKS